jgi:hypothetical protein
MAHARRISIAAALLLFSLAISARDLRRAGFLGVSALSIAKPARSLRAGDIVTLKLQRGAATITVKMPVKPRPFEHADDVDVTYGSVAGLHRTILTAPKSGTVRAAILYVNGIGCFSQESLDLSSSDTKLLYALTRRGFATMRGTAS